MDYFWWEAEDLGGKRPVGQKTWEAKSRGAKDRGGGERDRGGGGGETGGQKSCHHYEYISLRIDKGSQGGALH